MGAGGNVTLGAGGTVTLGAGGNVTLGAGGTVTLGAGGTVALGAGGNVTLGAGGTVALGAGGASTAELDFNTANSVVRPPVSPGETPMQGAVIVTWNAPAFGVVQTYTIYRSSDGATPIEIGSVSGLLGNPPATTFTDTTPDLISKSVVYTITTTLVPDSPSSTPRSSQPSPPAVMKNYQTISLSLPGSVSISNSPVTVSATALTNGSANGLEVNFVASGSCSIGSQSISGGISAANVTLNSTGQCDIVASQPGSDTYDAATPVSGSFTIQSQSSNTQKQTITFASLPNVQYANTFSFSASSSSGLAVSFSAPAMGPCTITGSTTTGATTTATGFAKAAGLCTITASVAGNSTYGSASAVQSFTITPAVLTVTASSATSTYGQPLPSLTFQFGPFVNGDTSAVVSGVPALSTTATTSSSPGGYPTTVTTGSLAAANYSFLYVPGMLTILPASQAITFTINAPSSAAYNTSFAVAATGGASGNPVTFTSSGACSITGTATGTATYKMTNSTGTCSVIANQAASTNYSAAPTVTQTVNGNGPLVTVSPSNISFGTVTLGSITTKNITVTDVGTAPVTISQPLLSIVQGGNSNEFVAVNLCPTPLSVGKSCTITIAFIAGPYYTQQTATLEIMDNAPGSPQPVTLTATVLIPQTITFTTNPPASAGYNSPFTVAATGGASGNPVTFTNSGNCSNNGATYTMTKSTGTCSVIANQAGNSTYAAAAQVTRSVTATMAPQTITLINSPPANAGYNSTFTVSATGGGSGNAVTFTSSGVCSNSGGIYKMTAGKGMCSVIANQAGNSNYLAAAQVTQSVTATLASQTITFTKSAPSSAAYNSSFTVSATGGASGNAVTFTSSGACSHSGATYTMTSGTGACSVIANQLGNSNYTAATQVAQTVSATQAAQTITFTTNAPATATYKSTFKVAATGGASGNAVTFTSSGACSNSGATYTMTSGTGTCSVIANQAGNSNYASAAQVTKTVSATLVAQTITFTTNPPATAALNSNFTVAATGGASGNAVTFTSSGSCSNSGAKYTMTSGTGTCSVIANQTGNSNYAAALQVTKTVTAKQ